MTSDIILVILNDQFGNSAARLSKGAFSSSISNKVTNPFVYLFKRYYALKMKENEEDTFGYFITRETMMPLRLLKKFLTCIDRSVNYGRCIKLFPIWMVSCK